MAGLYQARPVEDEATCHKKKTINVFAVAGKNPGIQAFLRCASVVVPRGGVFDRDVLVNEDRYDAVRAALGASASPAGLDRFARMMRKAAAAGISPEEICAASDFEKKRLTRVMRVQNAERCPACNRGDLMVPPPSEYPHDGPEHYRECRRGSGRCGCGYSVYAAGPANKR